jgi:hypothetical protein
LQENDRKTHCFKLAPILCCPERKFFSKKLASGSKVDVQEGVSSDALTPPFAL